MVTLYIGKKKLAQLSATIWYNNNEEFKKVLKKLILNLEIFVTTKTLRRHFSKSGSVKQGAGTKKNSTLEVKPHYVGSIEVTKRPIFVRGAVSLRALVRAVEPENRFWTLYF